MADVLRHEIMRAEQRPDIYAGQNCDDHRPRWWGSGEGDKDGDGELPDVLALAAHIFPPGTTVVVSVPKCPQCGDSSDIAWNHDKGYTEKCGCGFDWHAWADDQFA